MHYYHITWLCRGGCLAGSLGSVSIPLCSSVSRSGWVYYSGTSLSSEQICLSYHSPRHLALNSRDCQADSTIGVPPWDEMVSMVLRHRQETRLLEGGSWWWLQFQSKLYWAHHRRIWLGQLPSQGVFLLSAPFSQIVPPTRGPSPNWRSTLFQLATSKSGLHVGSG